jgi:hypothetical protein
VTVFTVGFTVVLLGAAGTPGIAAL